MIRFLFLTLIAVSTAAAEPSTLSQREFPLLSGSSPDPVRAEAFGRCADDRCRLAALRLSQAEIETYLMDFYGVEQILWVKEGIVGDDTDGHIDDTVRFVDADTVVTVIEDDAADANYQLLKDNLAELSTMRLLNGKQLNIVELPMPEAVIHEDQRLPASYANFYIANESVIVPTFRCDRDEKALRIIQDCFPSRRVVGIDSTDIIWGLGSFHCLSQQEPAV